MTPAQKSVTCNSFGRMMSENHTRSRSRNFNPFGDMCFSDDGILFQSAVVRRWASMARK
jgi:hypothetical protein